MKNFTQFVANLSEKFEDKKIVHEYNEKELREKYILGEIFNVDEWVKSKITEKVGKIIRKGTNYIICVTEEGEMFKSWIKDVVENKFNDKITDSTPEERLIGTSSYREYMEKNTPCYRQFINKYRKNN